MLAIMMFTVFCVPAFASEAPDGTNENEKATFDLTQKVAQEQIVTTTDGETIVYGVEPVIDPNAVQPLAEYENATGTWKIYWYSGALNGEYYIDINSSSKITRAYDQWHLFTGYTVANSGLEYTSTTARGWWDLELLGSSWLSTRWELRAQMNGTTLKTWVN
ncbi:hypothetical protein SAMN05518670_6582 [Paenibacillus sp. OK076]|nr:hypothetical protein SAMN05518670_6582 [Paenibacillus sp. OK076]